MLKGNQEKFSVNVDKFVLKHFRLYADSQGYNYSGLTEKLIMNFLQDKPSVSDLLKSARDEAKKRK